MPQRGLRFLCVRVFSFFLGGEGGGGGRCRVIWGYIGLYRVT